MSRECEATRYARGACSPEGPNFEVVYHCDDRVLDHHPACWTHGLAEVDRHQQSGGIAQATLLGPGCDFVST